MHNASYGIKILGGHIQDWTSFQKTYFEKNTLKEVFLPCKIISDAVYPMPA